MTKFYGETSPFSTEKYSEFANNYIKRATLPTVSPWECHVSNTWQNSNSQSTSNEALKDWQILNQVKLVSDGNGEAKIVLVSAPAEHEIAFIDWLSVTFKKYTFMDDYIGLDESLIDDMCVQVMEQKIESIFGFKISRKRNTGRNFFKQSYELVNHEDDYVGDLCIGGQRDSMMLYINGQGCLKGDYGWQERLYNFLKTANTPKITRIDLSHDDYDGDYLDIDDLNERESNKEFYSFGRPPEVSWYGDWKYMDKNNKGRTLQLGSRDSDRLLRAYEKGKQLGCKESLWVRLEVQLNAKHTHIPLDAIIKPSDYFINLYPCFKDLFQYDDQAQSKIEYVKRATSITIQRGVEIFRHQMGSWLGFFRQWFDDDKSCLDSLASEFNIPKRFSITKQDWSRVMPDLSVT